MAANRTDIWVYAHWKELSEPQLIGILSAHQAKGRKASLPRGRFKSAALNF